MEGVRQVSKVMQRVKRPAIKSMFGKLRASIILNSRSPCNQINFLADKFSAIEAEEFVFSHSKNQNVNVVVEKYTKYEEYIYIYTGRMYIIYIGFNR